MFTAQRAIERPHFHTTRYKLMLHMRNSRVKKLGELPNNIGKFI